MYQNFFSLVGKIEAIERLSSSQTLRLKLSDVGPIKVKAWAEVRDPELAKILGQTPNGFKLGDVVSLTGMIVLNESTNVNILVVGKSGASRIMAAPITPPVTSKQSNATVAPFTVTKPNYIGADLDDDVPF